VSALLRRAFPDHARPSVVATILMAGLGATLALFVPGFDAPNYYSSFALALFGGLIAGPVGVMVGRNALERRRNPFVAALHAIVVPSLAPLVVLLLNGVRVQQCDVFAGILFYGVAVVLTMAFAATLGAGLAALTRRRGLAVVLYYLVWATWVFTEVWHIYRHPAIFAYDPFAGFFSGALYDTVIELDSRLVLYRLNNLAQALLIVSFVRLGWDRLAGRVTRDALRAARPSRWVALVVSAAVCLGFWMARASIGYEVSRDDIETELGGVIDGPRLRLVYDRKTIPEAEAQALYEDHIYRLDQLAAKLGPFPDKITSYVYGSTDQKRRLMGAAQVYIAKPWLREVHLNRLPYGNAITRHELAHVVLGVFAPDPFDIPTTNLVLGPITTPIPMPQMALVEGAAETFEWDAGQLTPHQWSCAMRQAQLAPPLEQLLAADGFYKQASDKAYTLAGSFIRWLLDTYGSDKFERVYEHGDFEAIYGRPLAALVADWGTFVDGLAVPADAAGLATGRYTKVAVFYRVCGLDIARRESEAGKLLGKGERDAARALYQEVVDWVPDDPQKRIPLLQLAVGDNDLATAERLFAGYMALEKGRNVVSDAWATELLGDAKWRAGKVADAAALYASVADAPAPEDRKRNVLVKAWVAASSRHAPVGKYLLDGQPASLDAASAALPDDPLVKYLVGRRKANEHQNSEAEALLVASVGSLPSDDYAPWIPWVRRETWRMIGHARFDLGAYAAAAEAFETFANLTPYGGDRDRYLDWAERCRWKLAHPELGRGTPSIEEN